METMVKELQFEIETGIGRLREAWTELDAVARRQIEDGKTAMEYTFYQTFPWNEFVERFYQKRSAVKHGLKRIEYVVMKSGGKTVAILPLMVSRLPKKVEMTAWRVAGVNNVSSPYNDEAHAEMFKALAGFIADRYKGFKIRLFDLPPETPFTRALAALPGAGYSERGSYHIPLSEFKDFDEYYASLNKKLRHNIKTRSNHFTHGDLTASLRVFTCENPPTADYWKKIWRLFFMRKNVWRKREITPLRKMVCAWETRRECRGGMKTASFYELPQTHLFSFEINGEPAAFAFLYLADRHIVVPKLAIDTEQRAHAPGILMLKEIMKWCYDNGVRDFDLCRGEEPYKQQMGAVNHPVARIKIG